MSAQRLSLAEQLKRLQWAAELSKRAGKDAAVVTTSDAGPDVGQ